MKRGTSHSSQSDDISG